MTDTPELTGPARALAERIASRTATIGVVGLGYVGLPLAAGFTARGFRTVGVDIDEGRVRRLRAGCTHVPEVGDDSLQQALDDGLLVLSTDFSGADAFDVAFICVPTPVTEAKDPDMRHVESAAEALAQHLRPGQAIVLKSTTWPGTTERLVRPILERTAAASGWVLGRDYFLAHSPERIDPGNRQFTTENTPVVIGGVTPVCTELTVRALQAVCGRVHRVSSPRVAEMEKLLENVFRSVNIALLNELAQFCDRMGDISVWEIIEAASTKPFGFMPFYPGPGLGGHCIPIDPYYLSWIARRHDFETSFITLSAKINETMPYYVVDAVVRAIARRPVSLHAARVLILGAAFKRDVSDTRHSPAIRIIELLHRSGMGDVAFSDPHVGAIRIAGRSASRESHSSRLEPRFTPGESHSASPESRSTSLESIPLSAEAIRSFDVVVIVTDHSDFPYAMIAEHARLIVDTRNALKRVPHDPEKVFLLGSGAF